MIHHLMTALTKHTVISHPNTKQWKQIGLTVALQWGPPNLDACSHTPVCRGQRHTLRLHKQVLDCCEIRWFFSFHTSGRMHVASQKALFANKRGSSGARSPNTSNSELLVRMRVRRSASRPSNRAKQRVLICTDPSVFRHRAAPPPECSAHGPKCWAAYFWPTSPMWSLDGHTQF
jgi:hypothetical protein